jgi:hypothetical protein
MTGEAVENLVPLAKSWLYAPELKLNSSGFSNKGYDPAQAAYVLIAEKQDKPVPLSFTINASDESPMIDPAIVIKKWNGKDFVVEMNGVRLEESEDYRTGIEQSYEGYNLVLWLNRQSDSPVKLEIK